MMQTKTVLVTGSSSGFGRGMVTRFLEEGYTVVATLRNCEARKSLFSSEQEKYRERLICAELDVTSETDRHAIRRLVETRLGGRLDVLINNAGQGLFGSLEDLTEEQIRRNFEVLVFAPIWLTRELLPALRSAKGRLINMSSVLGTSGLPLTSIYCGSKFALEGVMESLRYELSIHGVQVSLVEPGGFRTQFGAAIEWADLGPNSVYRNATRNYRAMFEKRMSRPGASPNVVVEAVIKLASQRKMPLRVRCGKDAKAMAWFKRLVPEPTRISMMTRTFGSMLQKERPATNGK